MRLPKISIIIPSFNKVDFIDETLRSIVSQNYPNLEVIIQDGGSTDGTLEIIKKYARKYPEIVKYTSKKDKGQLDAINKGLKKATGDIFTYINADDVYGKGALKKVGEYFTKHSDTLWFAGKGRVIDKNGREIAKIATWYKSLLLFLNHKSLILILNYFIQPSVFVTREAYKKYGPFTGTKTSVMEYDLWLKLSKIKMPVIINSYLSSFRLSGTNISSVDFKNLLFNDEEIIKRYTRNKFILFLHKLNNLARIKIIGYLNS